MNGFILAQVPLNIWLMLTCKDKVSQKKNKKIYMSLFPRSFVQPGKYELNQSAIACFTYWTLKQNDLSADYSKVEHFTFNKIQLLIFFLSWGKHVGLWRTRFYLLFSTFFHFNFTSCKNVRKGKNNADSDERYPVSFSREETVCFPLPSGPN